MRSRSSIAGDLLIGVSLAGLTVVASGLADGVLRQVTGAVLRGPVGEVLQAPLGTPAPAGPPGVGAPPAAGAQVAPGGATSHHHHHPSGGGPSAASAPAPTPAPFRPVTRVAIPRLGLDAEVVPARLVERGAGVTWEVPAFTVGHAERTAGAGAPGNGVLVGHVSSQGSGNVFEHLGRVSVGDRVRAFSGGQAFHYLVTSVRVVPRTDLSVVAPTEGVSLSLITCTGPWLASEGDFAERLVVRAELTDGEVTVPPPGAVPPPAFPATFRTVYDARPSQSLGPGQSGGDRAGAAWWPHDPASTAWIAGDGYRLVARDPGRFVAVGAPPAPPAGDLAATAAFRKVGGPPGGGYGLIVRDQGPGPRDGQSQAGRYYVFEAGDRGEVGIWRREQTGWVELLPWTRSEAVRPGGAPNELTVQAVGQRVTFLVNGLVVASLADPVLSGGGVGVFVGGDLNEVALERFVLQVPE